MSAFKSFFIHIFVTITMNFHALVVIVVSVVCLISAAIVGEAYLFLLVAVSVINNFFCCWNQPKTIVCLKVSDCG